MHPDVQAILKKVNQTADFSYVEFTDINTTNALGDNALHCVIVWGDYYAVKTLLAHGINVNQRGEHGYTPLHQACAFGSKEIVALLLENGADIRARTDGDLPFTTARLNDNDEICDLLRAFSSKNKNPEIKPHERHLQALSNSIEKLDRQINKDGS